MYYKLLLLLTIFTNSLFAQKLSFYSEFLNFELDSSHFYVSGMYFFKNSGPENIKKQIYYPYVYPTSIIDTITIFNCNTMTHISAFAGKKGHWFNLEVPANDSVVIHIKYSHVHNDTIATYILLTTQYWNAPFENACYTLRVKNDITIDSLFLPTDSVWVEDNYHYYYWEKYNYMPKTNFFINFNKEKN